eukprot:TRINITY_DN11548_c0_g1_i1.p1 TRINITY_DN11548_c0_g1~~TRINITY_DN11548_c0_g1_i1.p1  ORF type:complete len:722 (+),score=61.03 TRINITY_DN11548_c0_g1_i1:108-2273(+)
MGSGISGSQLGAQVAQATGRSPENVLAEFGGLPVPPLGSHQPASPPQRQPPDGLPGSRSPQGLQCSPPATASPSGPRRPPPPGVRQLPASRASQPEPPPGAPPTASPELRVRAGEGSASGGSPQAGSAFKRVPSASQAVADLPPARKGAAPRAAAPAAAMERQPSTAALQRSPEFSCAPRPPVPTDGPRAPRSPRCPMKPRTSVATTLTAGADRDSPRAATEDSEEFRLGSDYSIPRSISTSTTRILAPSTSSALLTQRIRTAELLEMPPERQGLHSPCITLASARHSDVSELSALAQRACSSVSAPPSVSCSPATVGYEQEATNRTGVDRPLTSPPGVDGPMGLHSVQWTSGASLGRESTGLTVGTDLMRRFPTGVTQMIRRQQGADGTDPDQASDTPTLEREDTEPALDSRVLTAPTQENMTRLGTMPAADHLKPAGSPGSMAGAGVRLGTMPLMEGRQAVGERQPTMPAACAPPAHGQRRSLLPGQHGPSRIASEFRAGQRVVHEYRGLGVVENWDPFKGTVTVKFNMGDSRTYRNKNLKDGRLQPCATSTSPRGSDYGLPRGSVALSDDAESVLVGVCSSIFNPPWLAQAGTQSCASLDAASAGTGSPCPSPKGTFRHQLKPSDSTLSIPKGGLFLPEHLGMAGAGHAHAGGATPRSPHVRSPLANSPSAGLLPASATSGTSQGRWRPQHSRHSGHQRSPQAAAAPPASDAGQLYSI